MKKIVLVLLILAVVGGAAYSFDLKTFPSPIEKGNFLISPAFNLGGWAYYGLSTGLVVLGPTVAVDYALPIPLMVGLESGVIFITQAYTPTLVPIFARVSWHPNFEVKNLDTYLRFKMGGNFAFGDTFSSGGKWSGGFCVGVNVGARYFFTDSIGVFGELGYDGYAIRYKWEGSGLYRGSTSVGAGYAYTVFHTGVTFKVGGENSGGGKSSSGNAAKKTKGSATVTSNVNFRSGPSADSTVIRQIPQGTTVTLTGETSEGWTQIKHEGDTGWVSSQYIAKE